MAPSEQVKVFKELFESSRFQAVLHYYCGFTKLANPEIKAFIQNEISIFDNLLPLLHCFFEAQQPSLCQLVDPRFIPHQKNQQIYSRDLTPVEFLVIGYFLSYILSSSTTSTSAPVHFIIGYIDEHCLKMLLNEFSKYPNTEVLSSVGALSLQLKSSGESTEEGVHPALTTSKLLQVNKLITHLDLSNCSALSDSGAHWIFESLQNNNTLVDLAILTYQLLIQRLLETH